MLKLTEPARAVFGLKLIKTCVTYQGRAVLGLKLIRRFVRHQDWAVLGLKLINKSGHRTSRLAIRRLINEHAMSCHKLLMRYPISEIEKSFKSIKR